MTGMIFTGVRKKDCKLLDGVDVIVLGVCFNSARMFQATCKPLSVCKQLGHFGSLFLCFCAKNEFIFLSF